MKNKRFPNPIWGIALILILTACSAGPAKQDGYAKLEIECLAAYRENVTMSIQREETILLSSANTAETLAFMDMRFHAEFSAGDSPPGEPGLLVWVTPPDSENRFVTQLYQFDSSGSVLNQFSGQHGFTGLTYVYNPASGAELQFTCAVLE